MRIQKDISLKKYNTFGIEAKARYFVEITTLELLQQVLQLDEHPDKFIISGGSNMLITKDIDALVMHINMKGILIVEEDDKNVLIEVMAGENWHDLVLWTLDNDYGGLQNLSLIPGNTGTAPIQNIGAYGVELKDVFDSCDALNVKTNKIETFSKATCNFGYRDSFFKNEGKGRYIISSVRLKLTKKDHLLNTSYGAIDLELENNKIVNPSIQDISQAVVAIRRRKLPDPEELGNSGSFFKNPVLKKTEFLQFEKEHPAAPYYRVSDEEYKIPAGWLIEQCGFKGKKFGEAGVHKNQALVLVNHGGASGKEILKLAHKIQDAVLSKFRIKILPEVNIIE